MDDESTYHPDAGHPYLAGSNGGATILVLGGSLKGKEFRLTEEECLIGRDPDSHVVIQEKEVSRRHAMLEKTAGGYILCDLDSTNGVYINNLKLNKSVLKNGDIFQIGSCVFQFVWNPAGS